MQDFQKDDFDSKKWINKELESVKPEVLESTVSSLSLNLQVLGAEVNAAFENHIQQSLVRLPRSVLELEFERMSHEVTQLYSSLSSMLTPEIIEKQREAEEATNTISKLHQTKTKLDRCQTTLTKTVYLRENIHLIEAAFQQSDTSHIASEISQMQKALKAIEGFDHHDQLAGTIAKYEARLQEMVEVECVEALMDKDKAKAQRHLATLKTIGRLEEIMLQYTKRAVLPVVQMWKDFAVAHPLEAPSSTPSPPATPKRMPTAPAWEAALLQFLPQFHNAMDTEMAGAKRYYAEVFGPDATAMMLEWFTVAQREVARKQSAYYTEMTLEGLVTCYQSTVKLLDTVTATHLTGASPEQLVMAHEAATSPFASLQRDYPKLQQQQLLRFITSFRFVTELSSTSITINPLLVSDIKDSTSLLLQRCKEAVQNCSVFTGAGGDMKPTLKLIALLNDVLKVFSDNILQVVKKLRSVLSIGQQQQQQQGQGEAVKLKLTLQLYHTTADVATKVDLFNTWVQDTMGPSHNSVLLFADARNELTEMTNGVDKMVADLLFDSIRVRLSQIPSLPAWSEESKQQVPGISGITSFAGPLDYAREIGEYLIGLPELLSQASTGVDTTEEEQKWMHLIFDRAAQCFVEQVLKIPVLSDAGVRQLAADAEYLDNIMGILEKDIGSLKVLCILATKTDDDYEAAAAEVKPMAPNAMELHAALAVMRGIGASAKQQQSPPGENA